MRRLLDPMPETVTLKQRQASDPLSSVWVEANAGSGKTHVLTQRVLRLLLSGVPPGSILCLTYTKAAAAEMRGRVDGRLGQWAVLPDDDLAGELSALEGRAPSPAERLRARTLFAHALETPGGLKILTIHAFCESVLHRFPLEAGVPFDFTVLEQHEQAGLTLAAREKVLAGGLKGDSQVARAVESLFDLLSDAQITEAIETALGEARRLRPLLADVAGAKARLRRLVGFDPNRTRDAIEAEMLGRYPFGAADYAAVLAVSPPSGKDSFEDALARLGARPLLLDELLALFLTKKLECPQNFPRKLVHTRAPALAAAFRAEAERLAALVIERRRAELVERSEALLDVLSALHAEVEATKRARSLLDFDDLIARAVALFENRAAGAWVRYKLDAGIAHILLDEGQDTNPEQWRVIRALADEFFDGAGAVPGPRTLFAVGDVKQSIFSFQGARPELFRDTGAHYQRRAGDAALPFAKVKLQTSFRSLSGVLAAVDLVSLGPTIRAGLLYGPEELEPHESVRADADGTVTLWPPVRDQQEDADPDNWPLEVSRRYQSAARQVAERIAREVKTWVDNGRPLGRRGRAVGYDDVLVLVQGRTAIFREIIRALHRLRIPTPGADRLEVTSHIGVLDLMALGDVLLNPADDLQLAAVLRSPLYDLSEEDLLAVAHRRPPGRTLWAALAASPLLMANTAATELAGLRTRLDIDRPFEFYAHLLYAGGGLKRFHRRFGREVDDVFAEFLDLALAHEQTSQPSLQGFLAATRDREVEIKRELAEGGGVRVMTVHGAKGLEAPIVILADAATRPQGRLVTRPVHLVDAGGGPVLIHASNKDAHTPQTDRYRTDYEAAQRQEYWRKLYVGMTRAEDELYLTGPLTRLGKPDGTWYEAVELALGDHAATVTDAAGEITAIRYPDTLPDDGAIGAAPAPPIDAAAAPPPLAALPPPLLVPVLTPSTLGERDPRRRERIDPLATAAEAVRDADTARREGTALHALLQHLVSVPAPERAVIADRAVRELLPEAGADRHQALAQKARSLLARPEFAALFGPAARAEVPILAMLRRGGAPVKLVGRIDRLLVDDDRVLVVDFKSDAAAPADASGVPPAYRTQLGLYALIAGELFPDRRSEAAILWTAPESLMILPPADLREAIAGFTMA